MGRYKLFKTKFLILKPLNFFVEQKKNQTGPTLFVFSEIKRKQFTVKVNLKKDENYIFYIWFIIHKQYKVYTDV